MKCPYCATGVKPEWWSANAVELEAPEGNAGDYGINIRYALCPQCEEFVVKLVRGKVVHLSDFGASIKEVFEEELIYPKGTARSIDPEIPEPYSSDFREACAIQTMSPKASAALSRRILQNVLREEFEIQHRSLAQEIEEFIQMDGIPAHLSEAVDAIRNVGNFAAHPSKDSNTGEIVEVEPGEAEWLLDVLEALFDFAFVQPKRLKQRKKKLNAKLERIGKPPMKE